MKTDGQFSRTDLGMKLLPEAPVGDVAVENIFRFREPKHRSVRLLPSVPTAGSWYLETLRLPRRTVLWEGAAYAILGMCALALVAISLVRAFL